MAKVDEIRNGGIERVSQKERLIGNGSILQYVLSEHEFETLGEFKENAIYLSLGTMCVGLFIPSVVNLFNCKPLLSAYGFINMAIAVAALVGGVFSFIEYRRRLKKCNPIYKRLKDKAATITQPASRG